MSSPSIPARIFCYIFGFIMTCSTFVFIIPGSFWQLPKVLVIVGFVAVDTLWLTVADKIRIYFGKIKK
jgi:hypothetical protein